MGLHPQTAPSVPEQTARVARAAFRRGNPYLTLRDALGPLFADEEFRELFPLRGRPAEAPWRLALVTLLQFAEGLTDRQAAEAVRARLDWKYLLALELDDPGFDFSLLSEFRTRLLQHQQAALLFERLLERFRAAHLVRERSTQRTDSTHILAAVRTLNRLELAGETVRHTLNTLAEVAPDWVRTHAEPAWIERYGRPFNEWRLPQTEAKREELARTIGQDGYALLRSVVGEHTPGSRWEWLRTLPAVVTLQRVWLQQFYAEDASQDGGVGGSGTAGAWTCRWRTKEELPPAALALCSPYDPDARFAKKRATTWIGYKLHLTETCERTGPLLITDVQTAPAPAGDPEALAPIQERLAARQLLPRRQVADGGYVSGGEVVRSAAEHQVELVGPPQGDRGWQAREGTGFALAAFGVDWEAQRVRCPGGRESTQWKEHPGRSGPVIQVRFSRQDCAACPYRVACTRSTTGGRRLTLPRQAEYQALARLRQQVRTGALAVVYAVRAGIEGSFSQGVHRSGLRRCRYLGFPKVELQHLMTAAALNLVRVGEWLSSTPRHRVRPTVFVRAMAGG